jgi:serine/threonine-protein kinase
MDRGRWGRIEELCEGAGGLDPSEAESYLDAACGDDHALREEVSSLLAQLREDPDFLEHPAAWLGDTPGDAPDRPPELPGWRVIRHLGRGGMGDVHLAEPEGGGEPVAIKSLRPGLASHDVIERFGLERRILANLAHPNIARLVDVAETGDGLPCVVMEYVQGIPITAHADLRRLGIRDRVALVFAVCGAVEHAHRHLVVHRDLKPANILVGDDGRPVLLDFGIGKVLEGTDAFGQVFETSANDRLLTLDYAAPEQLSGALVTTATDVHALGIILHELLTGVHPFRSGSGTPGEVERAVLELVPPPPSTVVRPAAASGPVAEGDARARAEARGLGSPEALARRLAGDLDNIVLMALRKEPDRRYTSVAALGEDLRRFLDGRPVQARRDTLGYRARRFVRRNAGSVAVATLALLGLIGTTVAAVLESRRAGRQAVELEASRDEAVAVRGFLMEMFGATGAGIAVGGSESVRALLDRQAARIDSGHADEPLLAARLHEVVADAYERLGLPSEAIGPARRALALRLEAQGDRHGDVAAAENLLGWVLHRAGESEEAGRHLQAALAIRTATQPVDSSGLSRALNDLGVLYNSMARYAEAESVLVRALAIRRGEGDGRGLGVGITANNLAAAYYYQARFAEAGTTQEIAVEAIEAAVGPDHQRTVVALNNLAAFHLAGGEVAEAEAVYRTLLERQSRVQGPDHPTTLLVRTSLASTLSARPPDEDRAEALAEADRLLREVLEVQEREAGLGSPQLGVTLDRLAGVSLARGDTRGALALEERAVAVLRGAHGAGHRSVASATVRLGLIHARLGDATEARRHGQSGMAGIEAALAEGHPTIARARGRYCLALLAIDREAVSTRTTCERAIAELEAAPAGYRLDLREVRAALASVRP